MSDYRKRMVIEMDGDGWNAAVVSTGEFDPESDKRQRADQEALLTMVADLDRCEHGRHQGDDCSGCGGPSNGNPYMAGGQVLGFDISGRPYVEPVGRERNHAENWRPS